MADVMTTICDDLEAEHDALDAIVTSIDETDWHRATPADGWTVRDGIGHLAYFDGTALVALTDPQAFKASVAEDISARVVQPPAAAKTTAAAEVAQKERDKVRVV